MPFNVKASNFAHLRDADERAVKEAIDNGETKTVAKAFAEYLAGWNEIEHLDFDKFVEIVAVLRSLGFWRKLSINDFLSNYGEVLSPKVFKEFGDCAEGYLATV